MLISVGRNYMSLPLILVSRTQVLILHSTFGILWYLFSWELKKRCPIVRCLFWVHGLKKIFAFFFLYSVQYCIIFNHNTLKAHSSQNFGYSSFCIWRSLFISFENHSISHLSGEFLMFNWHMSSRWLQISWKIMVGVWVLLVVVVMGGGVEGGGRLGLLIRICQS